MMSEIKTFNVHDDGVYSITVYSITRVSFCVLV